MARWQKHARLGLGLFAVAFAAMLWFVIGERQAPPPVQPIERLDPKSTSEIRGGDAIQVKGAKRDIRVSFASQILYTDGRTKYTGFQAFIDDRGGRSFVVSGNEAWVGKDLSGYDVTGDVTLKTSDGLTATTPQASFTEAEGVLRGKGPLRFQRARVSGSGVGFTYDRALDRLWLLDKASINVAPAKDGGGMQVTSGAAGHSRKERYMRFERGARIERDGQVMESEHATVFLHKDRDEPETVELRGNSRITGAAGSGSVQGMQAGDINLKYAPDGRTLQQAVLVRQGSIQLGRQDGSAGQRLAAEYIDTTLAPDGAVTRLFGRDNVQVSLPATGEMAARSITAPVLNATGEPGRGLTTMGFENGVEYREAASEGTSGRVARARTLKAALAANGTIEQADFSNGFRFEDGRLVATSTSAVYDVTKGTLALRSPATAPPPRIEDERVTLNARTVDVTLSPRQLNGSGSVSAHFSAGRREGERGTTLFSDKEVLLIKSEKFSFDEQSGSGSYSDKAVLWQEQSGSQIRANVIAMNQKTGTLTATGKVVTTLPIAGSKDESAKGMSLAQAGEFQFDDAKRSAVFTTQAQFNGVQGNLRADRIELRLAPKDNALERLDAAGTVTALVEKRRATGQKLTYHPAEEKYVLAGTPVRLVEGCQESTGRTLTFYRGSENVIVDGNQEIRVQTKGGTKCPDVPPQ
jgi:lipopolysaccharide export system protein LptA